METITSLIIGVNREFGASLRHYFDALGERAACRMENDLIGGLKFLADQHSELTLIDATLALVEDRLAVGRIRAQDPQTKIYLLATFDRDFYRNHPLLPGLSGVISCEKFAEQFERLLDQLTLKEHERSE